MAPLGSGLSLVGAVRIALHSSARSPMDIRGDAIPYYPAGFSQDSVLLFDKHDVRLGVDIHV